MSGASELSWNKQALPPGSAQDAVVKAVGDEITEKGFVVANLDKVVNWARTGSLWPTIVLHFLWDASGVLGEGGLGESLGPLLQFAIIVAGFVGVAVLAQQRSAPPASSAPPSV